MRATVDGVEINYELAGAGTTIALTHGIGGTGADFAAIVPALAARYQVLTWDVRGFGVSGRPATGYSIARFGDDLAGLLDHLGIEQAVIGGTSMGGTVTQRFILDHPERTLAAVIMSTSSQVNEAGRARWQAQADAIEREGFAAWVRRSRPPEQTEAYLAEHPEVREAEERRIRTNPDSAVYAQVARAVSDYNYTEELRGVGVPALVLVGSEDKQTPPGGSVIISRAIPGAELHILPGFGHNLAREAPEQVVSLIVSFLERVLPGA